MSSYSDLELKSNHSNKKTNILFIIPGNRGHRLSLDLDILYNIREEYLDEYKIYTEGISQYNFFYLSYISSHRGEMLEIAKRIFLKWPNISHAIYLDPNSLEGMFYGDYPNCANVTDLVVALDALGIPSIPMEMDVDDLFHEISIRGVYRTALELITSIPRVIYESGSLVLPNTDIWDVDIEFELFRYLSKIPKKIKDFSPREFEKLIASVFKAHGFAVELTPESRDGGYDVMAVQHSKLVGNQVFLIECKKYSDSNKVGIGVVQRVVGVVNEKRATGGVIATTSTFTTPAQQCTRSINNMVLADYNTIVDWIKDIENMK